MPKAPSKITKLFRVRIDAQTDEMMTRFCKEFTSRYLIVHHVLPVTEERPLGNPHHHFYCETTLSQGNFSNRIKSYFGVSGDGLCVQKCDADRVLEYYSYLFNTKNGNVSTIVTYDGFSPLDILTYKENAKTIQQDFEKRLKEKKKSQFDIVELVLSRMDPEQTCFPSIVYDNVIDVCKMNRTLPRPYHVRDMISSVMSFSSNSRSRQLSKDLTLKFFSNV